MTASPSSTSPEHGRGARRPSLVIFDCDGVLVDSETVANDLLAQAVSALGWPITATDSHRRFRGLSMTSTVAIIEREAGIAVPADWPRQVHDRILARVVDTVAAIPGVDAVALAVTAAGISRCVGSSSSPDYLAQVLARTRLDRHFGGAVFSATMVAYGKPAPDLFLHAAARMGHAPEACAVIEDSLNGVRAGVAAGMRVIGYAGDPLTDADELARAGAQVVTRMGEVPALLGIG